jgi:transposase
MSDVQKPAGRVGNAHPGGIQRKLIANKYNITQRTVEKWVEAGMDPSTWETVEAFIQQKRAAPPADISEAKLKKVLLDCQHRENAIALQELQIAQLRRDMVPISEVREQGIAIGAALSAELGSMMTDMPGVLAGLDEIGVRERLQARLDLMLERTNDRLRETTN